MLSGKTDGVGGCLLASRLESESMEVDNFSVFIESSGRRPDAVKWLEVAEKPVGKWLFRQLLTNES
jgi:hypothetical protein